MSKGRKGFIIFKCKNGEKRVHKEVYFIHTLCNNIISFGQNNKVVLQSQYLWVYNFQDKPLMKVKMSFILTAN